MNDDVLVMPEGVPENAPTDLFAPVPWAEPSNREVLAAIEATNARIDEILKLVESVVTDVKPAIEGLANGGLLGMMMGGKRRG